jgi:hypothetical protein
MPTIVISQENTAPAELVRDAQPAPVVAERSYESAELGGAISMEMSGLLSSPLSPGGSGP